MGELSQPMRVYISKNCEDPHDYISHTTSELGAGILAGVLCASLALLMAGIGFLIWRYNLKNYMLRTLKKCLCFLIPEN